MSQHEAILKYCFSGRNVCLVFFVHLFVCLFFRGNVFVYLFIVYFLAIITFEFLFSRLNFPNQKPIGNRLLPNAFFKFMLQSLIVTTKWPRFRIRQERMNGLNPWGAEPVWTEQRKNNCTFSLVTRPTNDHVTPPTRFSKPINRRKQEKTL